MTESRENEPRYPRVVAAELAQVSIDFLERCEHEQFIRMRVMNSGRSELNAHGIRKLILLRQLQEDLELDFPALEVVLNMRRQILNLYEQVETMENYIAARAEALLGGIYQLRRHLAVKANWEK